ncbi:restriction endonuclease subunit S [Rothia nasimurium]|uniref:restriction endonuclease subunit S n=1 Tax=Rothia nasimurium TaxID=85336 RepID=UPI003621C020
MSKEVPFKVRWLSGGVPDHWQIVEPRRIFKLVKEPERPGDIHLTPSQKYGVLPQEEYMKITGARVVQNLSGTQMQHVEPGDFISHLRTFQGGLELATMPGKVSPAYTVLRPTEAVYPGFFKHILKSPGYISQIASVTDQLRDGQTMRFNEFNLTWLPLPPFDEQKKIADDLDRELAEIDELIDNFESFHKVLRERYESELEELLNNELSNIPHQKLSWHVEFMNGDRGVSYPSRDEFVQSGVPFVNAGHLREGTVDFSEMNYVSEAKYQSMGGAKLRNEDILYCLRGSVGKCGIYPQNHGALASSLVALRTKDQLLPKFLLLLLSSRNVQLHIDTLLTGSAQPNLSVEQLASVRIPVPDVSQQLRIVKRNDENKLTFESLDESPGMLELLSKRKIALLESYLSGEKNG